MISSHIEYVNLETSKLESMRTTFYNEKEGYNDLEKLLLKEIEGKIAIKTIFISKL